MIFVEDNKSYQVRQVEEQLRLQDEYYKKRAAQVHPQKQHILDIIWEADGPITIVNVANQFSREAAHHWDNRRTRAELRLRAFSTISGCMKEFLIARHMRKFVLYLGPDNPRRQAWLRQIDETIRDFPKPNIWCLGCQRKKSSSVYLRFRLFHFQQKGPL